MRSRDAQSHADDGGFASAVEGHGIASVQRGGVSTYGVSERDAAGGDRGGVTCSCIGDGSGDGNGFANYGGRRSRSNPDRSGIRGDDTGAADGHLLYGVGDVEMIVR